MQLFCCLYVSWESQDNYHYVFFSSISQLLINVVHYVIIYSLIYSFSHSSLARNTCEHLYRDESKYVITKSLFCVKLSTSVGLRGALFVLVTAE